MTVTDRETGATAEASGDAVALVIPAGMPEARAAQLLRNWLAILGIARRQTGGPAIGTGLGPRRSSMRSLHCEIPIRRPTGQHRLRRKSRTNLAPTATGEPSAASASKCRTRQAVGAALAEHRIARMHSVRLASSRSDTSSFEDARDGRTDEPPPMVAGHAEPFRRRVWTTYEHLPPLTSARRATRRSGSCSTGSTVSADAPALGQFDERPSRPRHRRARRLPSGRSSRPRRPRGRPIGSYRSTKRPPPWGSGASGAPARLPVVACAPSESAVDG